MRKFYIADSHFGHTKIISLCNRPFSSVKEMDETMIENWNKVVTKQDIVFHLGDISWYDGNTTSRILKALNGNIVLIKGNHDSTGLVNDLIRNKAVNLVKDFYETTEEVNGQKYKLSLMHYPMESWRGSYHGSIHLHGHCHGTLNNDGLLRLDVGVDCNNFTPISLEEVITKIEAKKARIKSGEEVSNYTWADRGKKFNELCMEADDDMEEFMKNHIKYKDFYELRSL